MKVMNPGSIIFKIFYLTIMNMMFLAPALINWFFVYCNMSTEFSSTGIQNDISKLCEGESIISLIVEKGKEGSCQSCTYMLVTSVFFRCSSMFENVLYVHHPIYTIILKLYVHHDQFVLVLPYCLINS